MVGDNTGLRGSREGRLCWGGRALTDFFRIVETEIPFSKMTLDSFSIA